MNASTEPTTACACGSNVTAHSYASCTMPPQRHSFASCAAQPTANASVTCGNTSPCTVPRTRNTSKKKPKRLFESSGDAGAAAGAGADDASALEGSPSGNKRFSFSFFSRLFLSRSTRRFAASVATRGSGRPDTTSALSAKPCATETRRLP